MKKGWNARLLVIYLWQHRFLAFLFLSFVGVFAAIFSLYQLEREAVFYAAGLCMLLACIVLAVNFFSYCKRHAQRRDILLNIQYTDILPKPRTLEEKDYQEIILQLKHICNISQIEWQTKQHESMDYYTAWVHQVKTPISVMRMALQAEDTEEHRELSAELFRIEQYVEMALSYLRLGSEASDYVFQEYPLDSIIRQAVHKYAPQFIRKRIRLIYEPSGATVLTDEKWLLFILEQILSNAIKYTQEGSVTITVTPQKILKIADTGIGIAKEDIPRIFEKGFTGYNGRADKKSTGLGLYLCSMAAGRLSHKISVESQPGAGTVFSINLQADELDTRQ